MKATLDMTPEDRQAWQRFQLRRTRIVEDCRQIQIDAEAWNALHPGEEPIVVNFDFVDDLAKLAEDEQP